MTLSKSTTTWTTQQQLTCKAKATSSTFKGISLFSAKCSNKKQTLMNVPRWRNEKQSISPLMFCVLVIRWFWHLNAPCARALICYVCMTMTHRRVMQREKKNLKGPTAQLLSYFAKIIFIRVL